MASRKIVWTQTAARQRRIVLRYWIEKTGSADYSIRLLKESSERLKYVKVHPSFGQLSDYPETRVISLGHYSIFYKLLGDNIVVTAFWDNRQDPGKLLKLLS